MKTESKTKSNHSLKERNFLWKYFFDFNGEKSQVCKQFLINLYQITERRIKTIQNKLLSQTVFIDKRGFQPKVNKINESIWESLKLILTLIPSKTSHYNNERSKKRYFDDPELNIKKLYELFLNYYEKEYKIRLTFSYETFYKYFNKYCNYAFRTPRIDRCDYCEEFENKENKSDKDLEEYRNHEIKVSLYREFKKKLIDDSKNLCLEFDYNSNKVLPKINNSNRYFKRALYLYLANFHFHKRNFSFIFNALEGEAKKGSNSICSYLNYVFNFMQYNVNIDDIENICLFSDACGGQNPNWTVIRYTLYLAILLQIKIIHIFPVRGHSYNICDSNFASIGKEFKRKAIFEVPNDYLKISESKKKFKSVKTNILDFEKCLSEIIKKNQSKSQKFSELTIFLTEKLVFLTLMILIQIKFSLLKIMNY
jgi:hypothetical protein